MTVVMVVAAALVVVSVTCDVIVPTLCRVYVSLGVVVLMNVLVAVW